MSIQLINALALLVLLTSPVLGFEVFVNGQPYRGKVKNTAIQGATLQFDNQGNLYVSAPELTKSTPDETKRAEGLGEGTFLVVRNLMVGHYQVKVTINGEKALMVRANRKQALLKVDHLLKEGLNSVQLTYYPDPDADLQAVGNAVEVVVARGTDSANGLVLKKTFGRQEHAAGNRGAEMKRFEFKIDGGAL